MSIHTSLKVRSNLTGSRSVLTRAERIAKKLAATKADPKKLSALGLAKTRVN